MTCKKLRQADLAALVGVDTRTIQQWENGERLPSANSLQHLIRVLVLEKILLPGEEWREASQLWQTVAEAYDERPGNYRLYPPFDEDWFTSLLPHLQQKKQAEKERKASLLPAMQTSFVGRCTETAAITPLLATTSLVTLNGPGGCGKMRLDLHIAEELEDSYPDGVWLLELAALSDPQRLSDTLASTLSLQVQPGQSFLTLLSTFLHGKQSLFIFDNCEHLIEACATLIENLLARCPQIHILATSREALNIDGETVWLVPSLSLQPFHKVEGAYERAKDSEAVQLFVERARNVQPHFCLTRENAALVIHICQQLDGIPLALELAAAHLNILS